MAMVIAVNGGVDVTESFALARTLPIKVYWALAGWARNRTNVNGMRLTLERIRAVAESDPVST